jgi:hypothetical protein
MASRIGRLGTRAGMIGAPAMAYLYTHPQERASLTTALKSTATNVAPFIKSTFYISPSEPTTEAEKIKYLTAFGSAIQKAKVKGYNPNQDIGSSETDTTLKEIFDRATYFSTQKGSTTIPTTLGGAEELYIDLITPVHKKAIKVASDAYTGVKDWWSTPKPLAGGKRKARRSKRSKRGSKRSRRNRSRRN